jgi:hypothetical protein
MRFQSDNELLTVLNIAMINGRKNGTMNKLIFGILATLAFCPSAFAHGDKLDMTGDGISEALKKFQAEEAAQAGHFAGVKGWLDADKIMVKIYLSNNSAVIYSCSLMEMGGGSDHMVTCTKSQ